jgi:hypothetical protein
MSHPHLGYPPFMVFQEETKRRGGHKQRRLSQGASSTDTVASNLRDTVASNLRDTVASNLPFNRDLVKDWANGDLTSKQVQRYAMHALQQGANGLYDFAKMGNWGNNPQNLFRAMRSVLGVPKGAPEMDWYEIPTKTNNKTPHPFLLPHRFFSAFYNGRSQRDWAKHITGPKHACTQFWRSIKDTAFVTKHPDLAASTWDHTVPIGMHADAGAFSKQDSIYVFSFNSLVGRGTTHQKRFIFTVVKKSLMLPNTMNEILRIFSWSCNALLDGKTPCRGPFGNALAGGGEPLAGPWRAALAQVRGDWAFYKECFNFPQWNSAVEMCWCCRASSTIRALSWTNFSPGAEWRNTLWTHETYVAHLLAQGLPIPILLSLATGLRLESIMIDVLHTIDLGVAAHIIGNILFIFGVMRAVFGGSTYVERIARVSEALTAWYKRTKCSSRIQGALTLERIRPTGQWPKLKAKAAACRHMARFALWIVETYGTLDDGLILHVIGLLVSFYDILESESQFLSESAKATLPKIGQRLAHAYGQLAKRALDAGQRLWKLSPKLHLAEHLLETQALSSGNPRWYWTYPDEDLVGLMIDIAEGCHANTMPFSVLFKWLHTMFDD